MNDLERLRESAARLDEIRITRSTEHVNLGRPLRADLDRVARSLGYDGTGLARALVKWFVEMRDGRSNAKLPGA